MLDTRLLDMNIIRDTALDVFGNKTAVKIWLKTYNENLKCSPYNAILKGKALGANLELLKIWVHTI